MTTRTGGSAQQGKKSPLTIYLTEEEMDRVAQLAKHSGRSKSDWARRQLLAVMDKPEE